MLTPPTAPAKHAPFTAGASHTVVSLQPALSSGAQIPVRKTTSDRLPSRKSQSILKILIQTTTPISNFAQHRAFIPHSCLPATHPLIRRRNTHPTDDNRSPAILKIPINPENPDSDNNHPRNLNCPQHRGCIPHCLSPCNPPIHPAQKYPSNRRQPIACHPENPYQS